MRDQTLKTMRAEYKSLSDQIDHWNAEMQTLQANFDAVKARRDELKVQRDAIKADFVAESLPTEEPAPQKRAASKDEVEELEAMLEDNTEYPDPSVPPPGYVVSDTSKPPPGFEEGTE